MYILFLLSMTSVIFCYVIRHIFMADFWLSAINNIGYNATIGIKVVIDIEKIPLF
ncbi:hypothetical protein GYH30_033640 [Glycine max]|uniref:Uncharacterized protein n=1 Tax=Glycine max TaxID=3847 RepID=K7LUM0_SOYBN|nr:hypothetical protein GYH30_033640 [Glycine max]